MKVINYTIEINGAGTKQDIAETLMLIAQTMVAEPDKDIDGVEWNDCTLISELKPL